MSEFDLYEDEPIPDPVPSPVPSVPVTVVQQKRCSRCIILAFIIVGLLFWNMRGCIPPVPDILPVPTPTPSPVIQVEKPSILFALPKNNEGMTVAQSQVAASQTVQKWCDDNGVLYRSYDVSSDLSNEQPQWRTMMDAARGGNLPAMVIVTPKGKGTVSNVPDTPEAAIRKIEELIR